MPKISGVFLIKPIGFSGMHFHECFLDRKEYSCEVRSCEKRKQESNLMIYKVILFTIWVMQLYIIEKHIPYAQLC
jgi:hypothetical protein